MTFYQYLGESPYVYLLVKLLAVIGLSLCIMVFGMFSMGMTLKDWTGPWRK